MPATLGSYIGTKSSIMLNQDGAYSLSNSIMDPHYSFCFVKFCTRYRSSLVCLEQKYILQYVLPKVVFPKGSPYL